MKIYAHLNFKFKEGYIALHLFSENILLVRYCNTQPIIRSKFNFI